MSISLGFSSIEFGFSFSLNVIFLLFFIRGRVFGIGCNYFYLSFVIIIVIIARIATVIVLLSLTKFERFIICSRIGLRAFLYDWVINSLFSFVTSEIRERACFRSASTKSLFSALALDPSFFVFLRIGF